MKRFLANTGLTLFTLAFAFGVGEVAVRLLYKDSVGLFPRYHTDYQYGPYLIRGIRPNSEFWHTSADGSWKFVTNNKGFRNDEDFDYERPANTLRVLTLGDSHTQGYEVRQESTYSAVLQRFLTRDGGNVQVLNAGVSGFSTAEALVLLENEGVKYGPDAVVLGFFANDFEDNLKAGLFGLDGGHLTERAFEHVPGVRAQNLIYSLPPVRWLGENSYFYSLLFNGVWDFFKERLAREATAEAATGDSGDSPAAGGPEYAIPTTSVFTAHQIELAAALIERMHRFCTQRGIRFIAVDVPFFGDGPYSYTSSVPAELADKLHAAGIEYISSDQVFADFEGAAELHVQHGQRHITEFTHTMLGLAIGQRLTAPSAPAIDGTRPAH